MNSKIILVVAILLSTIGLFATVGVAYVDCWGIQNELSCNSNEECTWKSEGIDSWCSEKGCPTLEGETDCNNATNLINSSCNWMTPQSQGGEYGWCGNMGCQAFQSTNITACVNNSQNLTCSWDAEDSFCYTPYSCGDYSLEADCTGKTGYSSRSCQWDSTFSYCYDSSCQDYDGDNSSCIAATGCTWDAPFCNELNCFNNGDLSSCNLAGCNWETDTGAGWCETPQCWQYDNISLGGNANISVCETDNPAGLNCTWRNEGWCDPANFEGGACSDFTNEFECRDSFYCFWDFRAETCNDPMGDDIFFEKDSPGCYIFDRDSTTCNSVDGCNWANNQCEDLDSGLEGVTCANITDSTMCSKIPMLSSCCTWQNGACASSFATTCWDQMQNPPEGAHFCEDYNAYDNEALCNQIADDPWYMPCIWDNSTENCKFNSDDFFGANESAKLIEIDNKQTCETANGEWVTETYCSGNSSVPVGRCERKFDSERNCNKACFACEKQADGSNWTSSSYAQTECEQSIRGCEFAVDSNSPNGWTCMIKAEFRTGQAKDCKIDCGGCTFQNDPQQACAGSDANCKWDPTTNICVTKSEKTCADACDRCYDDNNCQNMGRGGEGACKWADSNSICQPASGSSEVCWNGIDDDDDELVDCDDSNCFGECGGGGDANCFAYNTDETCTEVSGCLWFSDSWGEFCEFEGAVCWQNDGDENACRAVNSSCDWFPSFGGSQCEMNWSIGESCWQFGNNQSGCEGAPANCTWVSDEYGSFCEYAPFSGGVDCIAYDNDMDGCNLQDSCQWFSEPFGDGGWCDPTIGAACMQLNSSDCNANPTCQLLSGYCDPKGFGNAHGEDGGGQKGLQCFIYNGNETGCGTQDGCTYFPNPNGFCDMGKSCRNPAFNADNDSCIAAGCSYSNQYGFGECFNPGEICFMNQTLQSDSNACNEHALCNWTTDFGPPRCEPICFQQQTSGDCTGVSGCVWLDGFCEDQNNAGKFDQMEGGEAAMIAADEIGETADHVDIMGIGMKDMVDQFGFGSPVVSMRDAAGCNGKMVDGASGTGQLAHSTFFYLDTDGTEIGNCALHSNSMAVGYEFYFVVTANYADGQVSDTVSSYKCNSGSWVAADISASTFWSMVCQEIGGYMVAVNKADLQKFSSLYDSSQDMRIFIATANSSANITNPSDTAGPGWVTPGAVDFEIQDFGAYGADSAKFEDVLKQGFVKYENCYNEVDDDNDGDIDCNDYDCEYEDDCVSTGVNAGGFTDTRSPLVSGVKIEEYPDSALLMYDTNKPANGTVLFYGNDSTCGTLNTSIYDIGIESNYSRNFKTWHYGNVYSNTIGYSLTASTLYYYKLKVCDKNSKCAVSKCSSFKTSPADKCKYCNFVTRLKAPTSWYVFYDSDTDGTIDHDQGQVCGVSAGMKLNYTQGRAVDIYLLDNSNSSATNSSGMIFKNALVTKSALNQKVRDFDSGGSVIATTTTVNGAEITYTGMISETRDKIINNLFPEQCLVRIPTPSSGCPSTLWHCDDALTTCTERADVNLTLDGNNSCEYQIPFCQFSMWSTGDAVEAAGDDDSSSSSSGGGGGGGAAIPMKREEFKNGKIVFNGSVGDSIGYIYNRASHSVKIDTMTANSVKLVIKSVLIMDTLTIGQTKSYDVDEDKLNDISIKLDSIVDDKAKLIVSLIGYESVEKLAIPSTLTPTTGELKDVSRQILDDPLVRTKLQEYLSYTIDFDASKIATESVLDNIQLSKTVKQLDETSTIVEILVKNVGTDTISDLILVEAIPKSIIENVAEIRDPTPNYNLIIKEDPIIQWRFKEVDTAIVAWDLGAMSADQERKITYIVDSLFEAEDHISSMVVKLAEKESGITGDVTDIGDTGKPDLTNWILLIGSILILAVVIVTVTTQKKKKKAQEPKAKE